MSRAQRVWVAVAVFVGVVALIAALVAAILFPLAQIQKAACRRDAHRLDLAWTYDFWAEGCYVEVDGHMVPLDNVRITDDGRVLS